MKNVKLEKKIAYLEAENKILMRMLERLMEINHHCHAQPEAIINIDSLVKATNYDLGYLEDEFDGKK